MSLLAFLTMGALITFAAGVAAHLLCDGTEEP